MFAAKVFDKCRGEHLRIVKTILKLFQIVQTQFRILNPICIFSTN